MPLNRRKEEIERRSFLGAGLVAGSAPLWAEGRTEPLRLEPAESFGGLRKESGVAPLAGATWYATDAAGAGFDYRFPAGSLAGARYVTADMLFDGNQMIVFGVTLQEGEQGRTFNFRFSGLNQCSFRLRMPLSLVDQNRWGIDREGAFLKPRCSGSRVDLEKVDRLKLTVRIIGTRPARWCMTPLVATAEEVERIAKPLLPKGPLLDEMGQSTLHDWPGKSRNVEEVSSRIRRQLDTAAGQKFPEHFTRWGGWKKKRLDKGNGHFRVKQHDGRWWLVDPDGYAFWSAGPDCVRVDTNANYEGLETALKWLPDREGEFRDMFERYMRRDGKSVNFLAANHIRALGAEQWRPKWARIALAELRRLRFNTVGNWSEWEFASEARFPYVRPLSFNARRAGNVYRDFPDIYHADFEKDVADYADELRASANDPALIGYFLMNEPTWGFSSEVPAAGMLFTTDTCETRKELGRWLRTKYGEDAALAASWKLPVTFAQVAAGRWKAVLTDAALRDLTEFSTRMVERYFNALTAACKKVDPNHLNLGMRWAGLPPAWAAKGMQSFDVFSINCYRQRVPRQQTDEIHALLKMPVIVGEWHFGALDVGLPSSGIGHLRNQRERAKAYRAYLEDAAANPNVVGVHWFTLYDQSALGRFDGENYNIGFLDVCNRPYEEMGQAAITSHERMYDVADGRVQPFDEAIEYLPNLY